MTAPEITQADFDAFDEHAFYGKFEDASFSDRWQAMNSDQRKAVLAIAKQRTAYDARIAELEAERDAAIRRKVAAMDDRDTEEARADAAEAELDALKSQKWDVKHTDTMNTIVQLGIARDAAEAKLAEARDALDKVMALADAPAAIPVGKIGAAEWAQDAATKMGVGLVMLMPELRAARFMEGNGDG